MKNTTKQVLGKNLKRHLAAAKMSQVELAKALGVAQSSVSLWLNGATAPRADMLDKICKVLGLSRGDLILDRSTSSVDTALGKYIPLYNSIYADKNPLSDGNIVRMLAVDSTVKADLGIIVSSDSMSGAGIFPGDIAFFTKSYTFQEGRIYAVWLIEEEAVILKKVYIKNNQYVLVSENNSLAPIFIEFGKAFIIGELAGIYKEWKYE